MDVPIKPSALHRCKRIQVLTDIWTSFLLVLLVNTSAFAQSPLDNCADQFINGNIENAPTLYSSPPDKPYSKNKHLCYRDDGVSFYALEYWPKEYAPRWAAYRIAPENYGSNRCGTYTRKIAGCYFKEETWQEFLDCSGKSDPFHSDNMLGDPKLGPDDFSHTGHDRGHIAPRQAMSWHVCGTYQSFTMANMSPQRAYLNRHIWANLEEQVLSWGLEGGPIYVVTGATYNKFPYKRFQAYQDGVLDPIEIYQSRSKMQGIVEQHHTNFTSTNSGDMLHPLLDAKPGEIDDKVKDIRMPTGYFKVIYRPPSNGEPAHAIAFMMPHSFENLNNAAESYIGYTKKMAFWLFVSRIDLIEETSRIRFPGIPENMKSVWGMTGFLRTIVSQLRYDRRHVGVETRKELLRIQQKMNV